MIISLLHIIFNLEDYYNKLMFLSNCTFITMETWLTLAVFSALMNL